MLYPQLTWATHGMAAWLLQAMLESAERRQQRHSFRQRGPGRPGAKREECDQSLRSNRSVRLNFVSCLPQKFGLVGGLEHFLFSIIYDIYGIILSNWLIFFQRGWNHQTVVIGWRFAIHKVTICDLWSVRELVPPGGRDCTWRGRQRHRVTWFRNFEIAKSQGKSSHHLPSLANFGQQVSICQHSFQ